MKGSHKAILLSVTAIVIALVVSSNWSNLAQNTASITAGKLPTTTYSPTNQPTNQQAVQGYNGPVTVTDQLTDALNPSQTRTDATNALVTYYFQNSDGTYRSPVVSGSNTATVYVNPTIKTIWMQVKIPSGQAFYVAIDKMAGTNSRMGTPTWAQPDLSNLYSPVFPVDVTGLSQVGTGLTAPSIQLPIQLYTQSATSNVSINSALYITNTNHTAVGAGSRQNIEPLTLNFAVASTGIAISQIKFSLNDTTTNDINTGQSYCAVPSGLAGVGQPTNVYFNAPNVQQIVGASTVTYQMNIASDQTIRTANFIEVPQVGQNWVSLNCYIQSNLPATSNGITFTPSVIWTDMQGAVNTITGHTFKIVA